MTIVTPPPAVDRDRFGRPLVVPPNGGKPQAYQRCTTYIDVLEDKYNLQRWMQRMVALGLASRPDLLLSVSAHRDDKDGLNTICEKAREASAASAAATTGTALHALTELIDRGEELPVGLPAGVKASLDAYRETTKDLRYRYIEQLTVLDTLKVAGTPDRIGDQIVDLKTGSIEWGALKIAMQLSVYSRSWVYDAASHPPGATTWSATRAPHGASTIEGIVVHLPATDDPAQARCDLYTVDLVLGWEAVKVATEVRAQRKYKFTDLMHPYGSTPVEDVNPEAANDRPAAGISRAGVKRTPAEQVAQADSRAELEALWTAYTRDGLWTDELTAIAARRTTELQKLPTVA